MTDHSEGHPSLVSFAPESALNEVEDRLASESRIKAAVMAGEGEMPRFMRAMDWTKSPLGLVSNWPQSLRTALSICLNSRFPIAIWWGPELVLLYNDSWRLIFADEHPWMVGRPGHEYCPETWDVIGSMLKDLLETGRGVYSDDKTLSVKEHGKIHERYYSWSHSPIRSDDGGVGGVFTTVTETTSHVMATRELKTLPDFGSY